MSRPVPSPSIKGMIGTSGTRSSPPLYSIPLPCEGMVCPLYESFISDDLLFAFAGVRLTGLRRQRESKKIPQSRQILCAARKRWVYPREVNCARRRRETYDDRLE